MAGPPLSSISLGGAPAPALNAHMKKTKIPGWLGPIVGPIVTFGLVYLKQDGWGVTPEQRPWLYIGAAAAGLVAGVVVWLLDLSKSRDSDGAT